MKVLYLAGLGRSGSTLLARLLGQIPGWVAVGELHNVWRSGAPAGRRDELCGCGRSFADCPFWPRVLETGLAGRSAGEAAALAQSVARIRHLPWLARRRPSRAFAERLAAYGDVVRGLYEAAAEEGGGRVVVDSSKDAGPLWMLTRVPEVEVEVVHLVRDPRGVAFSWRKRLRRSEYVGREVMMPTWGSVETAWRWTYSNLLAEAAGRRHSSYRLVRYEEMVRAPGETLDGLVRAVEPARDPGPLPVHGAEALLERESHTLAGNPMRFETGRLAICADDAWREELPGASRRLVTLLTWPLLRRYGYRTGGPEEAV